MEESNGRMGRQKGAENESNRAENPVLGGDAGYVETKTRA